MNYKTALIYPLVLLISGPVFAGGGEPEEPHADIFIGRPANGNQTLIGAAFVPDELNLEERVFEGDAEPDMIGMNNFFTAEEPGFFNAGENSPGLAGATNPTGALPLLSGESFTVTNVPFTLEGLTDELFYWDGEGSVAFGATSAELFITQTDGMANTDGSIDDHPIFDIDDPGSDALPAGGIYLAPLTVQLDGLDASETALVLFVTGEQFEDGVEMAEDYLAGQLIPEPSAFALLFLATAAGLVHRRK